MGSSAAALAAMMVYPVIRYILPPASAESSASAVTLDFGPDDVPTNSGRIFKFGSIPGILVKTSSGELRAFSGTCTHLACIVQYRPDFGHIWCACHNGHFDLNGINIQGPPPAPLEPYTVKVLAGKIVVSKGA
jgi:Rieske Fe-S protein